MGPEFHMFEYPWNLLSMEVPGAEPSQIMRVHCMHIDWFSANKVEKIVLLYFVVLRNGAWEIVHWEKVHNLYCLE